VFPTYCSFGYTQGIIFMMISHEPVPPIREFPDRGVRWLLDTPENLRGVVQLLAQEITEQLDFSRAEPVEHTFIQENLRKWESDLLHRIPSNTGKREVWIYLLLEHQSTPNREMGLRLHNYMAQVWEMQRRRWDDDRLPPKDRWLSPIVPIVLYTGKRRWHTMPTLEAIMRAPEEFRPFIPRHETLFLNLRAMPAEKLQGSAVAYALRVLQADDAPLAQLRAVLAYAVNGLEALPAECYAAWHRAMYFLLALIRDERPYDEQEALTTLVTEMIRPDHREEMEEMVLTGTQYLLRKGREEGRVEGREEGLRIGQSELLLAQMEDKFGELPADVVTAVQALPLAKLKELAHQILHAERLADLRLGAHKS